VSGGNQLCTRLHGVACHHILKAGDFVDISMSKVLYCVQSAGCKMCMQRVVQKSRNGEGARVTAMSILLFCTPVYSSVLWYHVIGLCDNNHRIYMLGLVSTNRCHQ
jgi:hypothetical protein